MKKVLCAQNLTICWVAVFQKLLLQIIKSQCIHPLAAKPTISADTHIRFSNHAQPEATVAWELRPSLGTQFSGFNVHIRKRDGEGEWTTVRTEPFPYQANQTKRCETFSVPELVNHEDRYTYGVVVEAKCEGLESLQSNQVAVAIRKGKYTY